MVDNPCWHFVRFYVLTFRLFMPRVLYSNHVPGNLLERQPTSSYQFMFFDVPWILCSLGIHLHSDVRRLSILSVHQLWLVPRFHVLRGLFDGTFVSGT